MIQNCHSSGWSICKQTLLIVFKLSFYYKTVTFSTISIVGVVDVVVIVVVVVV